MPRNFRTTRVTEGAAADRYTPKTGSQSKTHHYHYQGEGEGGRQAGSEGVSERGRERRERTERSIFRITWGPTSPGVNGP